MEPDTATPTPLEAMTNSQLKNLCVEAGLPVYGTKEQLIERLQANAAADLTEPTPAPEAAPAVELDAAEPAEPVAPTAPVVKTPAVITTPTVDAANLPPANHGKHVQETLDAVRSRFAGLVINYDPHQEVFTLEGGRQGRVTLGARQPLKMIMGTAESYYNLARGRSKNDFGELM
jgi:hypothetical protein